MKTPRIALSYVLLALALAAGCSKPPAPGGPSPASGPTPAAGGHAHEHGERVDLGAKKIGAYEVHAYRVAKVVPGKEGDFDLEIAPSLPATVRAWVGIEAGVGSRKALFEKETEGQMHGHPEIPSPLPEGAMLWVEIEEKGAVSRGEFALKP